MGALIRSKDWSRTKLGPIESWPRTLVGYVAMVLEMPTPAILFWGPDQTQLYNEGYAVIMGPRHPNYFAEPYRECWPDTYPVIYPWMRKVLERGEVIHVEKEYFTLTRHGFTEEAYFTFTFSPLRDDSGAIAGIFQPVVEVTQTVLSERRSETLRALAALASGSVAAKDAFDVLSSNPKDLPFALLFRCPEEGAQELALAASAGLDATAVSLSRVLAVAHRVLQSGTPEKLEDVRELLGRGHIGPWDEPTRAAFVLPLRRSPAEAVQGVVVFGISARLAFDDKYREFFEAVTRELVASLVSEQAKKAERESQAREQAARAELEAEQQRLHTVFMQAPVAITILRGPEHIIELANPRMCRVWGRTAEQVLGKPHFEALPETAGQGVEALLSGVLATRAPYVGTELPVKLARLEGGALEEVYLNFVYEPMRNPAGQVEGVLVVASDVTQEVQARRRVEGLKAQAEEGVRLRDEFLSVASHELKTPLTPLALRLSMLKREAQGSQPGQLPREREVRHLEVAERQVKKLAELVGDLLDVSRLSTGRMKLELEPVDLSALVSEVVSRFEPEAERVSCRLELRAHPNLVGRWDRLRLEQVVTNLLSNALKYGAGRPIHITVDADGARAQLIVRDEGIGIAPDDLQRIFGRFERAVSERHYGGLGLGLYVTRQFVQAMGGTVEAQSVLGQGATFTAVLPLGPPVAGATG
ncbi:ATP-binding protein [Hyalangium rubrum]|uniref:histidine kinase n=1 Tax=Hyalangium rubrum TaxID=3103134 RepID=A0ABU5H0Q3_9BACT|nr:ATP-binding protein [Hyalangium sp. s54d21]MDY7227027.1 ATP-binding protein [Hyalangium sp. s54d21]